MITRVWSIEAPTPRDHLQWGRRGRRGLAGGAVGQGVAELAPSPVQAGHDRAEWGTHQGRDLAVRVALDVGEPDGGTEVWRQLAEGGQDGRVGDLVKRLSLAGTRGGREGGGACGPVPAGEWTAGGGGLVCSLRQH